jgi:hypothetical protein
MIPLGQPILVGHHAIAKTSPASNEHFAKAKEHHDKAEYFRRLAFEKATYVKLAVWNADR